MHTNICFAALQRGGSLDCDMPIHTDPRPRPERITRITRNTVWADDQNDRNDKSTDPTLAVPRERPHLSRGICPLARTFAARTFPSGAIHPIGVPFLPVQPDTEPIMATLRPVLHVVKSRVQACRVICPVCASTYCRRSARHGYKDLLRRLVGRFPWHCGLCGGRFYLRNRFVGEEPSVEDYAPSCKRFNLSR